jgi:rhamnogalacturonyl hydrolase YesR
MYRFNSLVFLILLDFFHVSAQVAVSVSEQRANIIFKNINQIYYDGAEHLYRETNDTGKAEKPHSFLWPLCGLIQAANEMDALQQTQSIDKVMQAIRLYRSTKPPVPGYDSYVVREGGGDRFYDDNQWVGLACIDAYNRTSKKIYLDDAKEIYRFMMSGYDSASGGGLYWKEGDHTSKNTCSNGPGAVLALQLYVAGKEKKYLDTAIQIYEWAKLRLQTPEGIYYDAIKIPGGRIAKATYTYNTGTMLQSAVLLYNITGKKKYLQEAERVANASLLYFYKGKFPGNYWFNAVLMRSYIELYKVDKNKKFLQAFAKDADRIWNEERDTNSLIGTKKSKTLLDQSGMLEIYARLAKLEKTGF